jgi:hypothetical protein
MWRFHTDSHHAQCCLEFSLHGNVSICVNTFFHFGLKCHFHVKNREVFLAHSVYKLNSLTPDFLSNFLGFSKEETGWACFRNVRRWNMSKEVVTYIYTHTHTQTQENQFVWTIVVVPSWVVGYSVSYLVKRTSPFDRRAANQDWEGSTISPPPHHHRHSNNSKPDTMGP